MRISSVLPCVLVMALLLLVPVAHAQTYSDVDYKILPVFNIYDPEKRQNELITKYSYEQLTAFFDDEHFRQWNDLTRVCQSMYLMFGRNNAYCQKMGLPDSSGFRSATSRAYISVAMPPEYNEPAFPQGGHVAIYPPLYGQQQYGNAYGAQGYDAQGYGQYAQPAASSYGSGYRQYNEQYRPQYHIIYTDPVFPPWSPTYAPYW